MAGQTQVQFIQFCIQYSSMALVYYDYILTLPREVEYIWKRPFEPMTVLYFFCRYSLIANAVYLLGLVNKFAGASCDTAYTIAASLGVPGKIGVLAILGVRACALYRYNKVLVGMFAVLGTSVVVVAIMHIPHVSCNGNKIKDAATDRIARDLLSVLTLIYEVLATLFVISACFRDIGEVGSTVKSQSKKKKIPLLFFMLQEGLIYSVFVTTFTLASTILNYCAPLGSFWQRLLNAYVLPLSGVLAARFLLHVREWKSQVVSHTKSGTTFSMGDQYDSMIQRGLHFNAGGQERDRGCCASVGSASENLSEDTVESDSGVESPDLEVGRHGWSGTRSRSSSRGTVSEAASATVTLRGEDDADDPSIQRLPHPPPVAV